MSQITLTGKIVASQPLFDNGSFRKQTLLIEVVNGNFTSHFPIDFINGDIDTVLPQVQLNGTYTFSGYVQGSKNLMQDRNGNPTAYLSISVKQVAPAAGAGLPQTTPMTAPQPAAQQGFAAPQAQPVQQGFVGAPAQQAAPSQPAQGFGNTQPQPAQQGVGTPAPAANQGFGGAPAGNGFGN